jgi:hypothetical protein
VHLSNAELQIRRAVLDDYKAIAGVLHDSFAEFMSLYTDGGFAAHGARSRTGDRARAAGSNG